MILDNFIKTFSKINGNFEFILNNKNKIDKVLFYLKKNNSSIIFDYIKKNIELNNNIKKIFNLYGDIINHVGYDKENNRFKFYIGLYNIDFKKALKIIKNCKDILNIDKKYYLEKDFLKFDSIGFDITEDRISMKIYELVNKGNNYNGLLKNIEEKNIKEIGYLKDFCGRKKKFFRFGEYQDIGLFNKEFDLNKIKNFSTKIKSNYLFKNKVKYFCIEGKNKEIYFI